MSFTLSPKKIKSPVRAFTVSILIYSSWFEWVTYVYCRLTLKNRVNFLLLNSNVWRWTFHENMREKNWTLYRRSIDKKSKMKGGTIAAPVFLDYCHKLLHKLCSHFPCTKMKGGTVQKKTSLTHQSSLNGLLDTSQFSSSKCLFIQIPHLRSCFLHVNC